MNQVPTSQRWSPVGSNPEDEFASFLDFGELNFSAFTDAIATSQPDQFGIQENGSGAMDTSAEGATGILGFEQQGQMQQMDHHPIGQLPLADSLQEPFNLEAELFSQHEQHQTRMLQQHYHAPDMVPPTPNSIEMHGGQLHYYQPRMDQQQQKMYEHYRRQQKDQASLAFDTVQLLLTCSQMNFTPLVSPAVTPLDTQLRYPDYAASSESFSPLTSPALRAQNHAAHASVYCNMRGSDTSDTTSPVDVNIDYCAPTSSSATVSLRKSRRKASTSSTKTPARTVRQSPAMKPQSRKKQPSSTVIPPKEVAGIIEEARKQQDASGKGVTSDGKRAWQYSQDSSGPDSVSPEPLSEILMPPPATPRSNSAGRSPYLNAKKGGPQVTVDETGEPATPASLMRLRKQAEKVKSDRRGPSHLKDHRDFAEGDMEQVIDGIALPEPAASNSKKPTLQSIDIARANTEQKAQVTSTRKTPRNGPVSAPITASESASASPSVSALTSLNGTAQRKSSDLRANASDLKKRGNTNSEKASPALRPRISPSIKPLLPEGGEPHFPFAHSIYQPSRSMKLTAWQPATVSHETSALLLASKSNYQNILEGTHFPGVSYPETLSTNLTSKRTSHKIAEQGRRNRINTALQEIASLLPPSTPPCLANGMSAAAGENNEGARAAAMMSGTPQQQSNSKASTVEAAIEYIRSLQKEVKECKEKIRGYEDGRASAERDDDVGDEMRVDGREGSPREEVAAA